MVTVASSGPRNARTDPETGLRSYFWLGRWVPSVTSLRSMAGMPHNLHRWHVRKICDRATAEYAQLGRLLTREKRKRERVLEENRLKEARAWLRAAPEEERQYKALRGTAVHAAAEQGLAPDEVRDYIEVKLRVARTEADGTPVLTASGNPSLHTIERRGWDPLAIDLEGEEVSKLVIPADDIRPRLRQYLHWLEYAKAEILVSEGQVWNLELGYAGSFDILCRFPNGEVWIVDIKTGSDSYSDYVLQQVAYLMGEFVGADDVVNEDATALLHQVAGVAILHLNEEGWEFLRIEVVRDAWDAFRGLLTYAVWTSAHATEETFTVASRKGSAYVRLDLRAEAKRVFGDDMLETAEAVA
jgi:hypothetical protein